MKSILELIIHYVSQRMHAKYCICAETESECSVPPTLTLVRIQNLFKFKMTPFTLLIHVYGLTVNDLSVHVNESGFLLRLPVKITTFTSEGAKKKKKKNKKMHLKIRRFQRICLIYA